ncbi:hypothetical protein C9273_22895, partial [Escherichia coli]
MKTYNTNPGYEMDPQLLTHFNQHLDSLFGIYSKLCKRKLTAVCSHQTRIGNLDAHLTQTD